MDFRLAAKAFLLLLLTVRPGLAQGKYLSRGQDGLSFSYGMAFGRDAAAFGAVVSMSHRARMDFGFTYAFMPVTDASSGIGYHGNSLGGGLTFHYLKPKRSLPFGVSFLASYVRTGFGGESFNDSLFNAVTHAFTLGADAYGSFQVTQDFALMPGTGVHAYLLGGETRLQGDLGIPVLLEGVYTVKENTRMVFGPSGTYFLKGGQFAFGAGLSLVLLL